MAIFLHYAARSFCVKILGILGILGHFRQFLIHPFQPAF